jgi:hypothetical protein
MESITCKTCGLDKAADEFALRSDRPPGTRRTICKTCRAAGQKSRYKKYKKESYFLYKSTRARSRSQSLHIPFDLDAEYLESIWTDTCPISEQPLDPNADRESESAPELDRLVPELGYTRGNVTFMSRKMNRIKNNVSVQELEQLLDWMKSNGLK